MKSEAQGSGHRAQGKGILPDAGCRMLDTRYLMLDKDNKQRA